MVNFSKTEQKELNDYLSTAVEEVINQTPEGKQERALILSFAEIVWSEIEGYKDGVLKINPNKFKSLSSYQRKVFIEKHLTSIISDAFFRLQSKKI